MKKLLLLHFFLYLPLLSWAEYSIQFEDCIRLHKIPDDVLPDSDNLKKRIEEVRKEFKKRNQKILNIETKCINESKKANSEFAAKATYGNCLDRNNYHDLEKFDFSRQCSYQVIK